MGRKLLDFGLPLVILLAATAIIAITGADLKVSAFFYRSPGWPIGDQAPWHQLYRFGFYPAYLLGTAALALFVAGFFRQPLARFRKGAAFMVLLLALGPGLMVNSVLKDHWGRPRPREITQFGGTGAFHQPWQRSGTDNGKSFPSGHGSSAFYLAMPYFVLRRRHPRLALYAFGSGVFYGVLMGLARIAQGGHFVSDILWAWGVVHLTASVLYYLLGLDRECTGNKH